MISGGRKVAALKKKKKKECVFLHRRIQDCFPPGCCKVGDQNGGPGGWPPGGGCKGAEPPCVGKFCISKLNSRDLVHTFYQHYI